MSDPAYMDYPFLCDEKLGERCLKQCEPCKNAQAERQAVKTAKSILDREFVYVNALKRKPTLSSLKKKAWKIVSRYVRLRDARRGYVNCYTCGAKIHAIREAQAGHAIPGRGNAVLLDVEILRPQCVRCNVFMRGRYEIFAAKLIREHSLEWFEDKLSGAREVVKLTRSDLEEFIVRYKKKLEKLGDHGGDQ